VGRSNKRAGVVVLGGVNPLEEYHDMIVKLTLIHFLPGIEHVVEAVWQTLGNVEEPLNSSSVVKDSLRFR
jgi:hypothetical protein